MKKSTLSIIPAILLAGSLSIAAEGDYSVIPGIVESIENAATSDEAQAALQGASEATWLGKAYASKGYNIVLLEAIEAAELSQSYSGGYLVVSSAKIAVEGLVVMGVYKVTSKIPVVRGLTRGFLSKGAWILGGGMLVKSRDNSFNAILLNQETLEATKTSIRASIEAAQVQIDEALGRD